MVLQHFGRHFTKTTPWSECVTSKADDIIKFLLLVFNKDFVVYDSDDFSMKSFLWHATHN